MCCIYAEHVGRRLANVAGHVRGESFGTCGVVMWQGLFGALVKLSQLTEQSLMSVWWCSVVGEAFGWCTVFTVILQ